MPEEGTLRRSLVSLVLFCVLSLASSDTAFSQTCVDPPSDLVSWWPGDGNASDLVDANDGDLVNGATFAPGQVGQAFSFDGVDDIVLVPNAANLEPEELTVDAWVFADSLRIDSRGPVIISKDVAGPVAVLPDVSYALFGPGTTGKFTATSDLDSNPETRAEVVSTHSFASGQFHHVAMTWDGSTLSLYVNGQLEGTHDVEPQTIAYDGNDLGIGAHPFFFGRFFDGLIDEVGIFNRALSDVEIQAIFDAGSAGKCKDADGDGVPNADDNCPNSDVSSTIVIDEVDTGVENTPLGDGCTMSDLITEVLGSDPSRSSVVHLLVDLKEGGIMTGRELGRTLKTIRALRVNKTNEDKKDKKHKKHKKD